MAPVEIEGASIALAPLDPAAPVVPTAENGWPQFRGPNRNGVALGTNPPTEWRADKNVMWATDVPGRGNSSPVVDDGRIFLTTADEAANTQSLLAYDLATGDPLWQKQTAAGRLPKGGMHRESSHAATTPAVGGGAVFVTNLHDDAVWASAWSVEGEKLWGEVKLGAFRPQFGYAASPVLYGSVVIVSADNVGPGFLVALDRESGDVRWRTPRDAQISFNTPLLATLNGRDTLIVAGNDKLDAYDPTDGSLMWSVPGLTATVSGSAVAGVVDVGGESRSIVIASGGYPGSETLAVFPPAAGETEPTVAWRDEGKAYVPSPLLVDGLAFVTHDDGRTWCFDAATGEIAWRTRLSKPQFRPSAVAVGTGDDLRVLQPSTPGITTVYRVTSRGFEKLAENQLGDECYASPAVIGDTLLIRSASGYGANRQDRLYRIAAD
ncbi:Outer membrane protein assembly factor BamB [Planctomycetes bacterium LzC2]|uniref:Outer membrane protein assembly factor BamB n=1 Tax=Alienimonas chondri TaxID=2681879 RepID=A0ABX1VA55_9PLAN|nr:Outer membrane protein assembly factor BamB [Alienimonas chondri]